MKKDCIYKGKYDHNVCYIFHSIYDDTRYYINSVDKNLNIGSFLFVINKNTLNEAFYIDDELTNKLMIKSIIE